MLFANNVMMCGKTTEEVGNKLEMRISAMEGRGMDISSKKRMLKTYNKDTKRRK